MGTVTAIRPEDDAESKALEGLRELIAREVGRQLAPLEEMLRSDARPSVIDERIDKEELARRLGKPKKTIDDWVYRHTKTKLPFHRFPTGTVYFKWSEIVAWLKEK